MLGTLLRLREGERRKGDQGNTQRISNNNNNGLFFLFFRDKHDRYPNAHGGPVHVGSPESIGISNLDEPDFGDKCVVLPGEVPVFWACGVTTAEAVKGAKVEFAITHKPGCMFVTDVKM